MSSVLNQKKKNKLAMVLNSDIFGNIIKEKRITLAFKFLHFKFFKKRYRKRVNIFKKVELQRLNYIPKVKKSFNLVKFRQKYILRRFYKNLKKKQFLNLSLNYLNKKNFIYFLESRLDMVLYRILIVFSLDQIRQLISHKKIFINYKSVNYMSYNLMVNDLIQFDVKFKNYYMHMLFKALNKRKYYYFFRNPIYIESDYSFFNFIFIKRPVDIPFYFTLPFLG